MLNNSATKFVIVRTGAFHKTRFSRSSLSLFTLSFPMTSVFESQRFSFARKYDKNESLKFKIAQNAFTVPLFTKREKRNTVKDKNVPRRCHFMRSEPILIARI